jgi:hypothetical protein
MIPGGSVREVQLDVADRREVVDRSWLFLRAVFGVQFVADDV